MRERYLKKGRTARVELIGDQIWSVQLSEHGVAESSDRSFLARSLGDCSGLPPMQGRPDAILSSIERMIGDLVAIERGAIAVGASTHDLQVGREKLQWQEQAVRVHLSLVRRDLGVRVLLDLGAPTLDKLRLTDAEDACKALSTVESSAPIQSDSIALEPCVSALLWPTIYAVTRPADFATGDFVLSQTSHDWVSQDGRGSPIGNRDILDVKNKTLVESRGLPNVFRPSYRFPPRRAPFNLCGRAGSRSLETRIRAVAPAGDVEYRNGRIAIPLLCQDRDGRTFAARLEMPCRDWLSSIVSIGGDPVWYPHGAGSLGQFVTLENVTLTP